MQHLFTLLQFFHPTVPRLQMLGLCLVQKGDISQFSPIGTE